MQPITGGLRAFFAPVTRSDGTPEIFDPSAGEFDMDAPPRPWIDLGVIRSFERKAAAGLQTVRTGDGGLGQLQFRTQADSRISIEFCEWGKLQMALAAGSQHLNVLERSSDSDPRAAGGVAKTAVSIQWGTTANEIVLNSADLAGFSVGDLIAVDEDYSSQRGYVGTVISGAYVRENDSTSRDADFVRRVTYNVARVTEKTATSLKLQSSLPGGTPLDGAKVQKVVGFVDREGGTFLQEWSAIFVTETVSGGRVCFYYPRLQTASAMGETAISLGENYAAIALRADFLAFPVVDPIDGEGIVSYRMYWPESTAPIC